jgi:expansin (peptidoglycan-binding protein)
MDRAGVRIVVSAVILAASACGGSGATGGGGAGAGSGAGGPGPTCDPAAPDHTGDGTFYDADGSGNCSFDPTGDLMVGAMNHVDYAGSAPCGACVHITGPSGEVTVRIVDQCPECAEGAIDLSPEAFAKLADPSLGRITIHWKYVACDVTGPIAYHFKEGSNEWWTAVQIRNSRQAIAAFEFKQNGAYVPVSRVDYNYFVADSGMGPGPYDFRVTDVNGAVLTDAAIPFAEAADSPGAAQFPSCGQ